MMIRWTRFNLNLMVAVVVALVVGCKTPEKKKEEEVVATMRLFEETSRNPMGGTQEAPIYREHPVTLYVAKDPFLTETRIKDVKVLNVVGGFALRVEFDRQGRWLLEQYTAATKGRHIAIFSQFVTPPEKAMNKGRWLAAPKISTHITDGVLVFTPDASREESEQIALGLNNVWRISQSKNYFKDE
jgi:hypothetical protein